jgi:hypothetical protein
MVEKLNSIGISITYNDVLSEAKGNVITRAHFANALLKNGSVTSVKEAFDRYIGDGKKAYIKRELPSAETAIHLISEAGGIAVLAHPLLYKMGQKQLENTIKTLSENGLAAIEAYYTTHSPSNVKYIKLTAEKFRLKISGGSDFHGKNKPDIDLGTGYGSLKIPYTVLSDLKEVKKNG